jgi:hypothetical protein
VIVTWSPCWIRSGAREMETADAPCARSRSRQTRQDRNTNATLGSPPYPYSLNGPDTLIIDSVTLDRRRAASFPTRPAQVRGGMHPWNTRVLLQGYPYRVCPDRERGDAGSRSLGARPRREHAGRVARSPVPGWDDPVPCIPRSCSPCACPSRWTHHGPFRSRCTGHRACPGEVRRGRHPRRGQRGRQGIPQDYSRGKKEGLCLTRGKDPEDMEGVSPTLLQGHSSRHPMPPGDLHGTRGQ